MEQWSYRNSSANGRLLLGFEWHSWTVDSDQKETHLNQFPWIRSKRKQASAFLTAVYCYSANLITSEASCRLSDGSETDLRSELTSAEEDLLRWLMSSLETLNPISRWQVPSNWQLLFQEQCLGAKDQMHECALCIYTRYTLLCNRPDIQGYIIAPWISAFIMHLKEWFNGLSALVSITRLRTMGVGRDLF